MIFDSFMINGDPTGPELDMLECRLTELEAIPNLVHVAVEADVDHQDHPKPYFVSEHQDRYAPWKERLRIVRASGLPTLAQDPDAWAREHAQREWSAMGMTDIAPTDYILHGDLDEIPNPLVVRNLPRLGTWSFEMVWCSFAVDWVVPAKWFGTVAARASTVTSFGAMRDQRNYVQPLPNAGFHLGWLGGNAASWAKLRSFCHPEIEGRIAEKLADDWFLTEGWHVGAIGQEDGPTKMVPVDIDGSWPRYVRERRCPDNWFRPRGPRKMTADERSAFVRQVVYERGPGGIRGQA